MDSRIVAIASFILVLMVALPSAGGMEKEPNRIDCRWLKEIRGGILAHDIDHLWSGSRKEGGIDLNAEVIFNRPEITVMTGTVGLNLGVSVNTQGDTSKLYGGMLWELEMKSGIFLDLGLGIAVHDGELETTEEGKKALGSRILFRIPIEFGWSMNEHYRILFLFAHVSNGYFAEPNEGLDTFGIRLAYRF
jgi:lipid A 3-O-deacylase